jgi:leucyl aminopeptidase
MTTVCGYDYTPKKMFPLLHVGLVGKGITFDTGGLKHKNSRKWFI